MLARTGSASSASAGAKLSQGGSPTRQPRAPARPRFSLISLFTNNMNQRQSKRTRSSFKKNRKSKDEEAPADTGLHAAASSLSSADYGATSSNVDQPEGGGVRDCPLCFETLLVSAFPRLMSCCHQSCENCLRQYLRIEIGESRVDITCPECSERLHPADIQRLLASDEVMAKYEEFMLRRVLVSDPDARWCPAPDCGYAVIARGCAGCPVLRCERPACGTLFCYHCKQEWHPNQTCDAARRERLPALSTSISEGIFLKMEEYKLCPRCKTMINKMDDGSCNHMTCSMCGAQFCWLCLKEASDLHYLSPSGCTFWGRKPWSRKKKLLWQIGILIGAPVGITLIAGLSVPALMIGLPIWAGRKLYQSHQQKNKHKRNLIVMAGAVGVFIVSPVVAAVAIAIGVPIMLTYVYGVVPVSLCRGGTCGVKNSNGTFSFDFGNGQDTEVRSGGFPVGNPSIAPSIGEMSLGLSLSASGSHMERAGLVEEHSDRESASIRNMVGASLSGSIYEPENAVHKKLEVHADIAPHGQRKCSIDSGSVYHSILTDSRSLGADNRSIGAENRSFGADNHSLGADNRSLDNKSHVSFNLDDVSTKGLAGSIIGIRDKDGISIIQPHDSDNRSRSCFRGEHGSPVSNRSVSFATHDELPMRLSGKRKSARDKAGADRPADRASIQGQCDTASASDATVSKRCGDFADTLEVDSDKPNYVTIVIKRTGANGADGTVLCNILEDRRLDSRERADTVKDNASNHKGVSVPQSKHRQTPNHMSSLI